VTLTEGERGLVAARGVLVKPVAARAVLRRGLCPVGVVGLGMCLLFGAAGLASAWEIRSPAFPAGGMIPVRFTCDGPDVSPRLQWTEPPVGTKGFALIVDDPDAPGGLWVHWVLYGMSRAVLSLPEGILAHETIPGLGIQGLNDFRKLGYGGPCPPPGPAHRYVFHLYGLDGGPVLPPGKTRAEVLRAIEGHVVGQTEFLGRYQRR
jgi:Raf kinase inhibitor-like YbhB/YbcL family protein